MARKISKRSNHSAPPARTASRAENLPKATKRRTKSAPVNRQSGSRSFPVVGIGASAGGLEAYTVFLKHLPSDTGMAFVLIQHLDPKQHSELTDLLSKTTSMPVTEVNADTALETNHVYVIAPAVSLSMSDGHLRAEDRASGRTLPIDHFLQSLAQDSTSKAIGIVLSGTASDGTLGLKAIKAEGGITFAQEPASAKFDGMPRSAIAAGVVDFVLAPEEIAKRLVRITRHPYVALKPEDDDEATLITESALSRMFQLLRTATGNDFTHYKHTTIRRRIHRRMVLHNSEKLGDYIAYLQENPTEVMALADDLLIGVTSFFREPEYFEALAAKVLPEILKNRSPDDSIRVWVPGCATGEEAYSIAICLTEFLERSGSSVSLQIFATDISEKAIEKARTGVYPMAALAEVSSARLKRFFMKSTGGYQIAKTIRESCVFARQNVTKDPPFHNLDLISCCNMLIYFEPVLQRKVLSTFHYALKPRGFLLLGPSESVGPLSDSFSPQDKKLKIYSKQPTSDLMNFQFETRAPSAGKSAGNETAGESVSLALNLQKTAERMLLAEYAPAGVIIDDDMNVVHVLGDIGPYLQLAPGEPTYGLLEMAREGLVVGLRAAVLKARQKKVVVKQQAHIRHSDQFSDVDLKVVPLNGPAAHHFVVLFEDLRPSARSGRDGAKRQKAGDAKPAKITGGFHAREDAILKQELLETREYLQSIMEEQEASTEELKSANEEAQASNEELETAKEELQSANEELTTVNDELKTRNFALTEANNDLTNVLTSINVPLVMVGKDLKIRHFTQAMEPMLNLIDSDIGRSISDFKPNIDVPDLPGLLRRAVNGERPGVREVQDPQGLWYSLQILPYRMPDKKIHGALLVLLDINAIKLGRNYADAVVQTVRQPLVILNKDLTVRSATKAFYETFKVMKENTENRSIFDLRNGEWNIPKLRTALEETLPKSSQFQDLEVEHKFEGIGRKTMLLSASEIVQPQPYGKTILLTIEDITQRKPSYDQIRRTNDDLKHFAYAASHDLQEPLRMVTAYTQLLAKEYKGKLDKNADQFITYAVEGAQRMDALLKGMLEYWQATDRGDDQRTSVDGNDVLEKAMLNLEQIIKINGAVVTHDLLPTVWAEEVMLVQIFQNLIGNAIKYRSKKRPMVHVSAGTGDRQEWVFSVKDNGIGIDPRYAEQIFNIFNRLHGKKYPGAGIGLAICKRVVEHFEGRIWVESKLGRGSDFKFTIPRKD